MITIRNYNETFFEYKSALEHLTTLRNKHEEIYTRYLGYKSPSFDNIICDGGVYTNKMNDYLDELNKRDSNDLSLSDKIINQEKQVNILSKTLRNIEHNLRCMQGIEYQLYTRIAVDKLSITRAVESVALDNNKEPITIWKYYYPRIKKEVHKIKKV